MKKILQQFSRLTFCIMPASALISWESPGMHTYANRVVHYTIIQKDTLPKNKEDDIDKAMKELEVNMDNLNEEMKNLNLNLDKQLESLSNIAFDKIQKQTEESLKSIDWNEIQKNINVSLQNAQQQIAKIDFTKMQEDMRQMQERFKSNEFKSQFNSEKMHAQIEDAMKKAKEGMAKAKQKLQQMKDFADALAADGLIDKKKGYTIEWKSGELYINNKKQPKDISDKYRKYESIGELKMEPEGAEHF